MIYRHARTALSIGVALWLSWPTSATAQTKPDPSLIGKTFTPDSRVVLYSNPENGLITRQRAKLLVAPGPDTVAIFPLTSDGGDYVTGKPAQSPGLKIEQVRALVQGKSVTHWLKVSGAGQSGWIKYDASVAGAVSPNSQ